MMRAPVRAARRLANDLGLLAEEYDVARRRQVGNFPQAFSHLTLILAARAIAAAEANSESTAGKTPLSSPHSTTHLQTSQVLPGAAFLGIGAMVGAGIFALSARPARSRALPSGCRSSSPASSPACSATRSSSSASAIPSSGGLIAYLIEGFGNGRLVGIASWLGYFSAIVIVCSMVSVSFGSYASSLFIGNDAGEWLGQRLHLGHRPRHAGYQHRRLAHRRPSAVADRHRPARRSSPSSSCVTIVDIDFDLLAFSGYPSLSDIISSVALTFFAYLGFSVITFSVGDLRDPARELPTAMYLALGVTSATYVLISLGVFGTLTVDEVTGFGETAIAEAARPDARRSRAS